MTVGLTIEYITPTKTDTWLVLQQSAVKTIAEDIFVSPRRITHLTLTRRQENISTFMVQFRLRGRPAGYIRRGRRNQTTPRRV